AEKGLPGRSRSGSFLILRFPGEPCIFYELEKHDRQADRPHRKDEIGDGIERHRKENEALARFMKAARPCVRHPDETGHDGDGNGEAEQARETAEWSGDEDFEHLHLYIVLPSHNDRKGQEYQKRHADLDVFEAAAQRGIENVAADYVDCDYEHQSEQGGSGRKAECAVQPGHDAATEDRFPPGIRYGFTHDAIPPAQWDSVPAGLQHNHAKVLLVAKFVCLMRPAAMRHVASRAGDHGAIRPSAVPYSLRLRRRSDVSSQARPDHLRRALRLWRSIHPRWASASLSARPAFRRLRW